MGSEQIHLSHLPNTRALRFKVKYVADLLRAIRKYDWVSESSLAIRDPYTVLNPNLVNKDAQVYNNKSVISKQL